MYNLDELADGELNELVNEEIKRVIQNIHDRETPVEKARKIIITLAFEANEARTEAAVKIDVKSKLVEKTPGMAITKLHLTRQKEIKGPAGQLYIDDAGDVREDDGKVIQMNLEGRQL